LPGWIPLYIEKKRSVSGNEILQECLDCAAFPVITTVTGISTIILHGGFALLHTGMIIRDAPGITISILTVVAADITSITRIDVVLEEEREELGDLVAVEAVEDQTVPVVSVAAVRSLRLREGLHYPRPPEAVLIKRVPIHHLSQIDLIEAEGLGHPV
jgi:hypothetical protein